jgi:hypothetical protein
MARPGRHRGPRRVHLGNSKSEHAQFTHKIERPLIASGRMFMIALVAGGGFEPPTFGL